ncbi:MAG: PPC domain-containing protein [Planctomyces sp.]|nr:PPC domain-containing protein [Planctomyces sp.]
MPRLRRVALCCCLLLPLIPSRSDAQLPYTRLGSLSPPGGQAGTTVNVRITGGDDLEEIAELEFSHPGISAELAPAADAPRPPAGNREGRRRRPGGGGRRNAGGPPPQAANNAFIVTIAPDVPPGQYEAYAIGYFGRSTPRMFSVGVRPELLEVEPNNQPAEATAVEVGRTVNAAIEPATDVDCYRFEAREGQRIVIDCLAARIDSRLRPVLEVFNAEGRKLAHARPGRSQDATLVFDVPVAGQYVVKVFDQAYRGGADHFYRLEVHDGPQIAFALPPAGPAGTTAPVALYGFNLPGGQLTEQRLGAARLERLDVQIPIPAESGAIDVDGRVSPVEAGTDAFTWRLQTPTSVSNPVRLQIGSTPATVEVEPNDVSAPQTISVPCDLGGQFQERGDIDAYEFDVKQGDAWWIEVFAQRLGRDIDPLLIVEHLTVDGEGKQAVNRLAAQDDIGVNLLPNGFDSQSDDAAFRYVAPSDGRCRIILQDRYGASTGDPSRVYRLTIQKEQPDFRLVVTPVQLGPGQAAPPTFRKGDTFTLQVLAFRREGFNGTIEVAAEGLPEGVSCLGTVIGPNQPGAPFVFTTTADTADDLSGIRIVGRAMLRDAGLDQAAQAAAAALATAQQPVANQRAAAESATSELQQAVEQTAAALKTSGADPENAELRNQVADAQQRLETAQAAQKTALAALQEAEAGLAPLRTAAEEARAAADTAARRLDRPARFATIVWSTQNNQPAFTRLSREFPVAMMQEAALYQLRHDVRPIEVHQGRYVFVPVTIERRGGFDAEVQVVINGRPNNANIDGQNFKFEPNQQDYLLSLFVKENSPPDAYALLLTGQGQVQYRRNPERTDRAKATLDELTATAQMEKAAAEKATQTKNEATQAATQAAEALTQAEQAAVAAKDAAASAAVQHQQAQEAADAAAAQAATETEAARLAEEARVAAQTALEADSGNSELQQALAAAEQAETSAKETAAAARQRAEEAAAALATAAQAVADADVAASRAEQVRTDAEAARKAAEEARIAAEQAEQAEQAKATAAEQSRAQAEERFNQANQASQPKPLNFNPNSPPIVIVVKPAPVKLSASGGTIKRGESLEVKATVTRQNGFAGPVTLSLALPPGLTGLSAEPVDITADEKEGLLRITAAADAPEGEHKLIAVRARCEMNGEAIVEIPITLTVAP